MERIEPPFGDQRFDNFDQWVSRAKSWLTCHADYNNTEHGKRGWRGHHFTALCFDSFGRRCRTGSDFQTALEQDAFPVWWIWPDQIVPALLTARAELDALRAQVEVMQDRLEMRHAFDGSGKRISVEPGSIPDGISCRDETIRQLDKRVDEYRAKVEAMLEALTKQQELAPKVMERLMATKLRDDLLLAHEVHQAGYAITAALAKSTGSPDGQH